MKPWPAIILCLLLSACAPPAPRTPHQEWTLSTGNVENARVGRDAARVWLLTHGYGLLEKNDAFNIAFVLRSDQDIAVVLRRDVRHPTLLKIRVLRRSGKALGPLAQAHYEQVTAAAHGAVRARLKP